MLAEDNQQFSHKQDKKKKSERIYSHPACQATHCRQGNYFGSNTNVVTVVVSETDFLNPPLVPRFVNMGA